MDWQGVLGIADPAPGDPGAVSGLADTYGQVSDNAVSARDLLNSAQLAAGSGQAMQAFHDRMGQLPAQITNLASSYGTARDALRGYASALQGAQDQAQRAWAQALPAHDDLTAARADVQRYHEQLSTASAQGPAGQAAQSAADTQLRAAQARVSDAQGRLDAARGLATQAADLRSGAARTAAAAIDQAASQTIPPRSAWQQVSDWFQDNPWIGYVLDGLAFLLAFLGPLGLILGAIAAVLSFSIQLLHMAVSGHFDVLSIVLSVVSLIPGAAFTKLSKLVGTAIRDVELLARAGDELGQAGHLGEVVHVGDAVGAAGAPSLGSTVTALRDAATSVRGGAAQALRNITGSIRVAGMKTGVRLGRPERWVGEINPGYGVIPERSVNCGYTALAVDQTLATGRLQIAGTGKALTNLGLEERTGSVFQRLLSDPYRTQREQIAGIVGSWDNGTRGIVNAIRPADAAGASQLGHMFNVMKWNDQAWVIDGQIGLASTIDNPAANRLFRPVADNNGFSDFRIMRTHGQ